MKMTAPTTTARSRIVHADAGAFSVADSVGAYMLLGVDAGAFSRGLMESARAEVAFAAENGAPPVSPYQLLELAYKKALTTRGRSALWRPPLRCHTTPSSLPPPLGSPPPRGSWRSALQSDDYVAALVEREKD
jgi:hypothetical protein